MKLLWVMVALFVAWVFVVPLIFIIGATYFPNSKVSPLVVYAIVASLALIIAGMAAGGVQELARWRRERAAAPMRKGARREGDAAVPR